MRCLRSKRDERAALLRGALHQRQPFGVAVARARQRIAVLRLDGAHAHRGHPLRQAFVVVGERARHPGAGIGDGEEALAVGIEGEARPAAEMLRRRGEHEAAAPGQPAEARRIALEPVEAADGTRVDGDRPGPQIGGRRLGAAEGEARTGGEDERHAGRKPQAPAAMLGNDTHAQLNGGASAVRASRDAARGAGAFSSNSSTSLSVMAPASSLGSVIVTARR